MGTLPPADKRDRSNIVNIHQKLTRIRQRVQNKFFQDSRHRQAALTGIVTLLVKGTFVGTNLLSIPITGLPWPIWA
jgi:hypothetical protein